jgi:hypothetical protein
MILFLATTYHPAYPMTGIFTTAQEAIDATLSVVGGDKTTWTLEDSGWFFKGRLGQVVGTILVKKLGSWDDFGPKCQDPKLTTWSAR